MTLSEKIEYFENFLFQLKKLCRTTESGRINGFKGVRMSDIKQEDYLSVMPHRNKLLKEIFNMEKYIAGLKEKSTCNLSQYKFKRA